MFKRFTPSARQAVLIATEEARGLGHGDIALEHLLLGALRSGGPSQFALAQSGVREGAIRARIGMRLPRGKPEGGPEVSLSADAVWTLAAAVRLADEANDAQVGSAHILHALVATAAVRQVLGDCDITTEAVTAALRAQPADRDDAFAAAVAGIDDGDPAAAARALMAIVLRRGPVAAWLAERGVDEAAVRRAFPALALQ
ncbi:MAG TPA: Clp protease N-terminal domain-containing protein, partial [Solirubrobacteraceae bacterium]|nr:Clp protease N-terminal domain-containing protein [Solirubrobacteraceae bacterium]